SHPHRPGPPHSIPRVCLISPRPIPPRPGPRPRDRPHRASPPPPRSEPADDSPPPRPPPRPQDPTAKPVTPVPAHPRRPPGVFRLWLLRPLAVLLGLGVPCLVLAWGVSRLVGDRVHAVQYVFWIPTFAFAGVAWVLFAGHAAVRPFA